MIVLYEIQHKTSKKSYRIEYWIW